MTDTLKNEANGPFLYDPSGQPELYLDDTESTTEECDSGFVYGPDGQINYTLDDSTL